jgi:cyclopropane-fatty-acyl-phospholipid synthase
VQHRNPGLHYAETLKAWRDRFAARREEAARLDDERFARMWEFHLVAEMSFRTQGLMNFQIQLAKRQGVVPMTRDYIGREEARAARRRTRPAPEAADRRLNEYPMFDGGGVARPQFRRLKFEP